MRNFTIILTLFTPLLLSGFTYAKDPDSSEVIRSGLEIFSLVEKDLKKQGLIIKSIEDMTARRGCEGAFHLSLQGKKKKICAGGRDLNYVKIEMHNLDRRIWEVVSFGPGTLPGVKGVQGVICTEGVKKKMYEHGIEALYIDAEMGGEDQNIALCMTYKGSGHRDLPC